MAAAESKDLLSMEEVRRRLDKAVERLEARARAIEADGAAAAQEVLETRATNAALKAVNSNVSKRLDTAIGRLRAMLEE